MCSGRLMASKTKWRGASNSRVKWISVSDGVVTLNVSLFPTPLVAMCFLLRRCRPFHLLQIALEVVELAFPKFSIPFRPGRDLLEGRGVDRARAPLRFASARDQSGALEHPQVLG